MTTLVVPMPTRLAPKYNVSAINFAADGTGEVLAADKSSRASIHTSHVHTKDMAGRPEYNSSFTLTRKGEPSLVVKYQAKRDEFGTIFVNGDVAGEVLSVEVVGYSHRLAKAIIPKIKQEDFDLMEAMSKAFEARANLHDSAGCALAGVEVIVSAFMLHPIGIGFGFVGMIIAC
jgi:hypothetical protein